MARVPTAEPRVGLAEPQFSPQQLDARGAFGEIQAAQAVRAGEQLRQLGGQIGEFALKMQREQNVREAQELDTEYAGEHQILGFGDEENPGFYALKGQAAVDGHPIYQKNLQEARRQIAEKASNKKVLALFNASADQRDIAEQKTAGRHFVAQHTEAINTASQARMAASASEAASHYNDPERLEQAFAVNEGEVARQGDINGWDDVTRAQKLAEVNGATVKRTFDAAIAAEDITAAATILQANKDRIDAVVATQMTAALTQASTTKASQILADEAMSLYDVEDPQGRLKALQWIRENSEGKPRSGAMAILRAAFADLRAAGEEARAVVNHQWTQMERQKAIKLEEAVKSVMDGIYNGQNPTNHPQWNELPPSTQSTLLGIAAKFDPTAPIRPDMGMYETYSRMSDQDLIKVHPTQIIKDLGYNNRFSNQILDRRREILEGKGTGRNVQTATQTFNSMAQEVLPGLTTGTPTGRAVLGRLRNIFMEELEARKEATGVYPSVVEQQDIFRKISDFVATSAVKQGRVFAHTFFYRKEGEPAITAAIRVPDETRQSIIDAFVRRGQPSPTQFQILQVYLKKLEKEGKIVRQGEADLSNFLVELE